MTNHEKIKKMKSSDLALLLDTEKGRCSFCAYYDDPPEETRCNDGECKEGIEAWLQM